MVELLDIEGYTFDKEVLRLAIEEYEEFRGTEEYDEKYKWETFEELNKWFDENEITEDNIVDFVEFIQEENQGSGYFVHWSELDDLREYADENPEELAELFDNLYHGKENLQDRLANFREKTGIGTPGLGYVLAAYDYEKYAPIKVDEFRYFFEDFVDQMPSRITKLSIPEKYSLYYQYCNSMAEFLEEEGVVEEATPLDAQDFYYTIEAYDKVNKEKIFLEYIWQFCQRFDEFKKNTELLIEEINSLPIDFLKSKRDSYEHSEKVNKIRYLTLDKLIEEGDANIEKIETEVNREYDKNILQAWTSFTIHSQVYWDYFSHRVNKYFESVKEFLLNNIDIEGLGCHTVTFQGSRNRPTVLPWMLIYPEEKGDHRDSYQFFFRILPEKIEYGLSHGENIEDSEFEEKYVGEITEIDENSLEQIVERYNQVLDEFKELNEYTDLTEELILSSEDLTGEIEEIFREVFIDETLIDAALNHYEIVFEEIRGEKGLRNNIAVTWRKRDRMISVNIGNWKIFRIAREGENYRCAIAVDLDIIPDDYESWLEYTDDYREFGVGENHKLIEFEWHPDIFEKHPTLKDALKKSTSYAFDHFNSSAYTEHQHEGLFKFFTGEEYQPSISEAIPAEEEEGKPNYFWITANPDIWSVSEIEDGGKEFYTAYNKKGNKRRIFDAFKKAKPGDKVIFYEASPVKKVVAEGEVARGFHTNEQEGYDEPVQGIDIRYTDSIRGISWSEINSIPKLEESQPLANRAQGSLFELTKEEYETILALEPEEELIEKSKEELLLEKNNAELDFDIDEEKIMEGLHFPSELKEDITSSLISALKSGKHIILTGPPGTGKTKLAKNMAKAMKENCDCVDDFVFTTATADWTTFDTMGGYQPSKEDASLEFKSGQFLKCFKEEGKPVNKWLIIDEINRADIDKAFGQLFSVLSKDEVELPFTDEEERSIRVKPLDGEIDEENFEYFDSDYYVTRNWRLLATMNTFDKASLYEMSYAFMRRFAFIDVGVPTEEFEEDGLMSEYIEKWDLEEKDVSEHDISDLTDVWEVLNTGKRSIGPAIIKDMLMLLKEFDGGEGLVNALKLYVLPQLEGMVKQNQEKIFDDLIDKIGHGDELEKVARERFEIELKGDESD